MALLNKTGKAMTTTDISGEIEPLSNRPKGSQYIKWVSIMNRLKERKLVHTFNVSSTKYWMSMDVYELDVDIKELAALIRRVI